MVDDVPASVKQARLTELIDTFQRGAHEANQERIGQRAVVLVEGTSRRSSEDLVGRTDTNIKTTLAANQQVAIPPSFHFVENKGQEH
jgi:tRNA A37 methylthiotransferase MiaB